jgi:N-acetylglucosamine-6-phosphate deacetylase
MIATITANVPLLGGVHDIAITGGTIRSVTASRRKTDLYAGPTLFDIQVNGYAGRSCRIVAPDRLDTLSYITRLLREQGVGWWMPTITTAAHHTMLAAFAYGARALDSDRDVAASVQGFHLEGPYISPVEGPRGAHVRRFIRPPDWDEFQRYQDASGGRIKYVTLAPEWRGAPAFIRRCVRSGVTVAIGHTNLDRDDLRRAVDAGATLCTHLGNGAHDMLQRHNNYIWYQLASRDLLASFISDGHHLPDEVLYSLIHAKGLDLSLITSDAIELAGLRAGTYTLRGREVEKLRSGRIVLKGTRYLAGSGSNQRECLENVIRAARLDHAEGWRLASLQPAKALGLDRRLGIAAGKDASLTVYRLRNRGLCIKIVQTWVGGRKVFDAAVTPRLEASGTLERLGA